MTTRFYDQALQETSARLDSIGQTLIWADAAILSGQLLQKKVAYLTIANAYVLAASAIEEFIRAHLKGLISELHKGQLKKSYLRTSILGISEHSRFDSLQDLREYEKEWQRKLDILASVTDDAIASFSPDHIPLDGRTIRPVHLQTIWQVFGFHGSPFPDPLSKAALMEIANGRNDVAHGAVDPIVFARRKGVSDTTRKINLLQTLLTHLAVATDHYLDNKLYLR